MGPLEKSSWLPVRLLSMAGAQNSLIDQKTATKNKQKRSLESVDDGDVMEAGESPNFRVNNLEASNTPEPRGTQQIGCSR